MTCKVGNCSKKKKNDKKVILKSDGLLHEEE